MQIELLIYASNLRKKKEELTQIKCNSPEKAARMW